MATKRGQMSRSLKQMAASKAAVPRFRTQINSERAEKPPAKGQNFIERLPSEILLKILLYLDAASLFSIGHCNKLFYQLSNDNTLWFNLLIAEFEEKECAKKNLLKKKNLDQASGIWKQTYFNNILSSEVTKWTSFLKPIIWYIGLPSQTKEVLRNLGVVWELTVTDTSGHECTLDLSWSKFFQTSVTLCWFGGDSLPNYEQISTLQLHGVRRIDLGLPSLQTPGRRSLMVNLDMQPLTESTQVIGQDRLVQLKSLQPGVIVGVWKDQCTIAFIVFTLHFYKLVERSVHPSSTSPYVELIEKPLFDDIDPEYGLHGYGLHISLHDSVRNLMSERFTHLFCRREDISDNLIRLTAVSRTNLSQHKLLSGSITLPWVSEAIQGAVENCCIMSLTLLHTSNTPFKCVCTPVSMEMQEATSVSYDYDGDSYLIHFQDSDFQVKMQLVKTRKDGQFILVSLNVYLSVSYVNKLYLRNY